MENKFAQYFEYDQERYSVAIVFFDNMIRRDFLKTIRKILKKQSGMICGTIGYNLSFDCDWVEDGVELWCASGVHDNSCHISYDMFVELIELSAYIWLDNNRLSLDGQVTKEVENSVKTIKELYS